ncbi:antirestriction protein, partial [Escherichia coli]|nr:antirestriction protein [Escherichia coli]
MNVMLSAPGLYFLAFIHTTRISLMKIVSQNTTALSSATVPGNDQPQLVATPV